MWIKLWADHGGGHQSHSEKYLWFEGEPDVAVLEDMWDDWTYAECMNNFVGGSEIVEKPPVKEIEYLLSEYRAREEYAQKMIRILEGYSIPESPVKEEPPRIEAGWGYPLLGKKWHYFNGDWISLCGKWMYTGELEEGKDQHPDNCRACTKKLERLNKKKEN